MDGNFLSTRDAPFPFSLNPTSLDEEWMIKALKEAWKAFQADEVPVGALLVKGDKIIGRGHNEVELLHDATAHAEMIAMTAGASALGDWRLEGTTLYTTLEPCMMCAGALLLSRVECLVWGAPDIRHGADGSFVDLFSLPHPTHSLTIRRHVLEAPCAELMKAFFQKKR